MRKHTIKIGFSNFEKFKKLLKKLRDNGLLLPTNFSQIAKYYIMSDFFLFFPDKEKSSPVSSTFNKRSFTSDPLDDNASNVNFFLVLLYH